MSGSRVKVHLSRTEDDLNVEEIRPELSDSPPLDIDWDLLQSRPRRKRVTFTESSQLLSYGFSCRQFAMQSENAAESLLSDGRDLHAVVRQPQITTCPVVSHPRRRSYVGIRRE
ncbi:hypothetical protein ACS0PU_003128 [Formica fusca]